MARVLISEPHRQVRRMIERMVTRLGHEAMTVSPGRATPAQLRSADVLLVEPAAPQGAELAHTARVANPALAVICASLCEPPAGAALRDVQFAGQLAKPFTVDQLADAIEQALQGEPDRISHGANRISHVSMS